MKEPNAVCANCNTEFYKRPSSKKNSRSGLFFCTRLCKDTAQRIGGIKEIHPSHYGDELKSYRENAKRFKDMSKCERCGFNKHPEILQVHHKDRNRTNGSVSNLEILCPNCHMYEHYVNEDGIYNKGCVV